MTGDQQEPSRPIHLIVAPDVVVRWHEGDIDIASAVASLGVRTTDPLVLHVLHGFAAPATIDDVCRSLSWIPVDIVKRVIADLTIRGILLELRAPQREPEAGTIDGLATAGATAAVAGPLHVLFVLPPNLGAYGEIRIPSGILMLASLADQAGYSTDFLLASSPDTRRTTPSEFIYAPAHDRLPAILLLMDFVAVLAQRLARARSAGQRVAVAISCFSSSLYVPAMLVGTWVRRHFPDVPILTGGYHPTIDPESMLRPAKEPLGGTWGTPELSPPANAFLGELEDAARSIAAQRDFVFDYVFQGRAEKSFLGVLGELTRSCARAREPRLVEGQAFEDSELRAFRYSQGVLARLAGPADPSGAAVTRRFDLCFSLGCPYSCHFCINSTRHEHWQGVDVNHAVEVLEYLHLNHQVRHFSLLDANFAADPAWRRRFFRLLAGKDWAGEIQLDIETSVTTLDLPDFGILDHLGLTVQVGVESCDPGMLRRMNKTRNPASYRKRLKRLIESVAAHVDLLGLLLIVGFPGETRGTLRESMAFLYEECNVLAYPNVAVVPQLYLPLIGTESANRTAAYARELGYEPNECRWWLGGVDARFEGLRPSRDLPLDTCARLAATIWDYHFGERATASRTGQPEGGPPPITVKTRLAKRAFLSSVRRVLADP